MKATDKHRRAWRARWNQARQHCIAASKILTLDPAVADAEDMADLRATLNDLTQCFHEASAYRTAHENEGGKG